ncbi:MAG TPA: elongation factor P [Anaerolineae bacterium]|nr:elongation factor P [Anaerolineae bacterium]
MIDVNELRKGVTFTMDGELYKVLEYQHHKPGRGKATIRTTLRNLRTGATIQHNFISGDRVEDIRVERRGVQYLYNDGNLYYFMDTETYDQMALPASVLEEQIPYLKESMELVLALYEDEPLDVELPTTVDMEVVEAEMAIAGDTATGAMKKVKLETGLEVQVPLFVEQGDVIRVDTRTGKYVTRV